MENYWFYTLSAIPQTLAAMIALAAMFVVFRLDVISKKIDESRIELRRFILLVTSRLDKEKNQTEIHEIEPLSHDNFLKLYEKGLNSLVPNNEFLGLEREVYRKYGDEMWRIINQEWRSYYSVDKDRIFGYLTMKKEVFERLLLIKRKSLFLLITSLAISAITISASLCVLPNYAYLNGSWSIVYTIVILAVLSIVITSFSVWTIVKN